MDCILLSGNIQECLPPKIQYGIFPSHYWKEFRSGRVKTGHVKRLLTSHLVKLGNIFSLVTLIFSNTPLVEVKQAQNTWSYRQISKFSTTWKYSRQSGHTNISIHTSCRSETSSKCLVVQTNIRIRVTQSSCFGLGSQTATEFASNVMKHHPNLVTCLSHATPVLNYTALSLSLATWGSSVWRCECDQYWKYFQVVLNEMSDVSRVSGHDLT